MLHDKKKVIAIVGPTACGKTGIGVKLAKEFDGEIISADSRQVYRGLDLGTGKEGRECGGTSVGKGYEARFGNVIRSRNRKTIDDTGLVTDRRKIEILSQSLRYVDGIPQWMIDIADPMEKMTLFDYLPLARRAIEDILSRGRLPIIVGGTGLYVQGLAEGFELQPTVISTPCKTRVEKSPEKDLSTSLEMTTKKYTREQLDKSTVKQLNNILQEIDPEKYEKVDKKNRHRLIRAIELAQEGLKPVKVKPDFEVLQIGVDIPRKELHERIDKRVDGRFEQGMLEEVIGLINEGVNVDWLKGLGLEYREITEYLLNCHFDSRRGEVEKSHEISRLASAARDDKECEFELMKQQLKFKIHQFARRQLTWFRRFPEINWLSDYKEIKRFVKIFLEH